MEREEQKKEYEISFLLKSEEEAAKIADLLKSYGVSVSNEIKADRINLAYPIGKEKSAFFGYFWFEAEGEIIKELGEKLKLNDKVLRFLIITPPIKPREKRIIEKRPFAAAPSGKPKKAEFSELKEEKSSDVVDNAVLEKTLEEILK